MTDETECGPRDGRVGTAADQGLATLHQTSSCGRPDCRSSCSLCSYDDAVDAAKSPPETQTVHSAVSNLLLYVKLLATTTLILTLLHIILSHINLLVMMPIISTHKTS